MDRQRWQILIQFFRKTTRLSLREFKFLDAEQGYVGTTKRKPTLAVDIGKRRQTNALNEYRQSFASRIEAQKNQTPRALPPEHAEPQLHGYGYARQAPVDRDYPSHHYDAGGFEEQQPPGSYGYDPFARAGLRDARANHPALHREQVRGGLPQILRHGNERDEHFADDDEFDEHHHPARLKRNRKELIAATLAGAICAVGGVYIHKSLTSSGSDSAIPAMRVEKPVRPRETGGKPYPHGKKLIYDRLTPDGPQISTPSLAEARPGPRAAAPAQASIGGSNDRIDETPRKAEESGNALVGSPTVSRQSAPAGRQGVEQPTIVRSETYRPDGTRVDTARPPFEPAAPLAATPAPAASLPAPYRPVPASGAATQQLAVVPAVKSAPIAEPSSPAQAASTAPTPSTSGYFVQIKSNQDENAAVQDLKSISEEYKVVLGRVPILTRSVDLGAKGAWFRLLAGPLNSREEALDLCSKMKNAGLPACIVYKSE